MLKKIISVALLIFFVAAFSYSNESSRKIVINGKQRYFIMHDGTTYYSDDVKSFDLVEDFYPPLYSSKLKENLFVSYNGGLTWYKVVNNFKKTVSDNYDISKLVIYPNPAVSTFNISFYLLENSDVNVYIISLTGEKQLLWGGYLTGGIQEMNFKAQDFESGTYILKLVTKNQFISSKVRIVK